MFHGLLQFFVGAAAFQERTQGIQSILSPAGDVHFREEVAHLGGIAGHHVFPHIAGQLVRTLLQIKGIRPGAQIEGRALFLTA